MRELGLPPHSAGGVRVIKRHVVRLGLDTSHFTGQRRWTDLQLKLAVANANSWWELFSQLGRGASDHEDDRIRVKAHAARLGLDLSRLEGPKGDPGTQPVFKPDIKHLREAGTAIAVMWFLVCGYNASLPIEPTVYDVLASMPDGIKRVQVKTTTYYKNGWAVVVGRRPYSVGNREPLVPYDPEQIDFFFILDGDLNIYVIPSRVIAGRVGIMLSNYEEFIVGSAASFMNGPASAA